MLLRKLLLGAAVALAPMAAQAQESVSLNCKSGPIERAYGGSHWLVYGCDDRASVAIVSAPGNPAMPYSFVFYHDDRGYHLQSNGASGSRVTDAAYKALSSLSKSQIVALAAKVGRQH